MHLIICRTTFTIRSRRWRPSLSRNSTAHCRIRPEWRCARWPRSHLSSVSSRSSSTRWRGWCCSCGADTLSAHAWQFEAVTIDVASTSHQIPLSRTASASHQVRLSRRLFSAAGWLAAGSALVYLSALMVWILGVVFIRGFGALAPSLFTTVTQGNGGGLLNAIEGTAVLSLGALLLAVPFGVAAGTYVSECRFSRWASVIRFLADVFVGVPSIVLGYFGYVTMVEWLGWKFSVAAGSIILAMLCLPYICRTTELALGQVSNDLREAAYALGASDRRVILKICLPAALPGVLTGILLALAISVGET